VSDSSSAGEAAVDRDEGSPQQAGSEAENDEVDGDDDSERGDAEQPNTLSGRKRKFRQVSQAAAGYGSADDERSAHARKAQRAGGGDEQ
jgi:hypothetical protein